MAAMADETSTALPQGGRPGGNREPGGFRIRLSDNELRAARAVQEAFRLRSSVAVLGFCLRTVAQLLEEGKLDALVTEMRNQSAAAEGQRDGAREGGRGGRRPGSEGRGPRPERQDRVDPFARPSKPKPSPVAAEPAPEPVSAGADDVASTEAASTEAASADTADTDSSSPAEPSTAADASSSAAEAEEPSVQGS